MYCKYIERFPKFPCGEETRRCILERGHAGNHVVIEPRESKRLEVLGDKGNQPRSGHVNFREYISALSPSEGN
jgi:hypothetical protein